MDVALRRRIRSHHTATHLLQSALKKVLGVDTSQQGSSVDAERLRCGGGCVFGVGIHLVDDVSPVVEAEGRSGWGELPAPPLLRMYVPFSGFRFYDPPSPLPQVRLQPHTTYDAH